MGLMADRNMMWLPEQIWWRCSTCPSPPPAARCPGHRAPTSCRPTAPSPRSAPSASPSGSRTQCSSADFCFSSITHYQQTHRPSNRVFVLRAPIICLDNQTIRHFVWDGGTATKVFRKKKTFVEHLLKKSCKG